MTTTDQAEGILHKVIVSGETKRLLTPADDLMAAMIPTEEMSKISTIAKLYAAEKVAADYVIENFDEFLELAAQGEKFVLTDEGREIAALISPHDYYILKRINKAPNEPKAGPDGRVGSSESRNARLSLT